MIRTLSLGLALFALSACGQGEQPAAKVTSTPIDGPQIGGPFALVDQHGQAVTERALVGKPSLVFFGFTYCPEVCPTTLSHMTSWFKQLGPDGDKLNAFYITVDPQRDTAKQMKQYLTAFDGRIRGLTGTPDAIAKVAKEYRVYYKRVPLANGDYVMDHSTMVYMMDATGRFVGPIGYNEPDAQVMPLLRDLVAGRTPTMRASTIPAVERSGS